MITLARRLTSWSLPRSAGKARAENDDSGAKELSCAAAPSGASIGCFATMKPRVCRHGARLVRPSPSTILVVEDDQDSRDLIAEVLTSDGYAVTQARNGRDALAKLSTMSPEPTLVLLDMMMPEMDGEEFLRVLGPQRLVSLPVVVLSGYAPETRALGARGVLRKPIEMDALLELVRKFCGGS